MAAGDYLCCSLCGRKIVYASSEPLCEATCDECVPVQQRQSRLDEFAKAALAGVVVANRHVADGIYKDTASRVWGLAEAMEAERARRIAGEK